MIEILVLSSASRISSLEENTVVFTKRLPSQVTLTYTGESRKISANERIHQGMGAYRRPSSTTLEVIWSRVVISAMTVPNNGPNYEQALRKGKVLTLFITAIGREKYSGQAKWFFIVNKIESPRDRWMPNKALQLTAR